MSGHIPRPDSISSSRRLRQSLRFIFSGFEPVQKYGGFGRYWHQMTLRDRLHGRERLVRNNREQPDGCFVADAHISIIEQYRQGFTRFGAAASQILFDGLHVVEVSSERLRVALDQIPRLVESKLTEALDEIGVL